MQFDIKQLIKCKILVQTVEKYKRGVIIKIEEITNHKNSFEYNNMY